MDDDDDGRRFCESQVFKTEILNLTWFVTLQMETSTGMMSSIWVLRQGDFSHEGMSQTGGEPHVITKQQLINLHLIQT